MFKDYSNLVGLRLMFNDGFLRELEHGKNCAYVNRLRGLYNDRMLSMFKEISKKRPIEKIRIEPNAYSNLINLNKNNITEKNIKSLVDNCSGEKGIIYFNDSIKNDNLNFLYLIDESSIRIYCFCGLWSERLEKDYLVGFLDIDKNSDKREIVKQTITNTPYGFYKLTGDKRQLDKVKDTIFGEESKETDKELLDFLNYCSLGCLDGSFYIDERNGEEMDEFISILGIGVKSFINSLDIMKKTNQILFALSTLIYSKLTSRKDDRIIRHFESTPYNQRKDYFARASKYFIMTKEDRKQNGVILLEQINTEEDEILMNLAK